MSEKVYRQVVDEAEEEEKGICRKKSFLFVSLFIALLVVIAVIWLFLTILAPPLKSKFKNNSTSTIDELETLLQTCRNLSWHLQKRINEPIDPKTENKDKEEFREKTRKFMDCGQQRTQASDGKPVKELEKKIKFLETLLKTSDGGGQLEVNVDLSSGNTHYYRHYHYQKSVNSVSWLRAFFILTLILF